VTCHTGNMINIGTLERSKKRAWCKTICRELCSGYPYQNCRRSRDRGHVTGTSSSVSVRWRTISAMSLAAHVVEAPLHARIACGLNWLTVRPAWSCLPNGRSTSGRVRSLGEKIGKELPETALELGPHPTTSSSEE
jgi:hypothetical protein